MPWVEIGFWSGAGTSAKGKHDGAPDRVINMVIDVDTAGCFDHAPERIKRELLVMLMRQLIEPAII